MFSKYLLVMAIDLAKLLPKTHFVVFLSFSIYRGLFVTHPASVLVIAPCPQAPQVSGAALCRCQRSVVGRGQVFCVSAGFFLLLWFWVRPLA